MIYVFYADKQRSFLKREAQKITKQELGQPDDFNYQSDESLFASKDKNPL